MRQIDLEEDRERSDLRTNRHTDDKHHSNFLYEFPHTVKRVNPSKSLFRIFAQLLKFSILRVMGN